MENKLNAGNQGLTSPKDNKTIIMRDNTAGFASPKFTRKRNSDNQTVVSNRRVCDNKTQIGEKLCYISPKKNILECMNGGTNSTTSLASMPVGRTTKNVQDSLENNVQNLNKNSNIQINPRHDNNSEKFTSPENKIYRLEEPHLTKDNPIMYNSPNLSSKINNQQGQQSHKKVENLIYPLNSNKRPQRRSMKISREEIYPSIPSNRKVGRFQMFDGDDVGSQYSDYKKQMEYFNDSISEKKSGPSKYLRENFYSNVNASKYISPKTNEKINELSTDHNNKNYQQFKQFSSTLNLHSKNSPNRQIDIIESFNRQYNSQKQIQDAKSKNNGHLKMIMSKKVEEQNYCTIEKGVSQRQLLNKALKDNEQLKVKIEGFEKEVKQKDQKCFMLKEQNNFMYRKIEEISMKMMEKDNEIRRNKDIIGMKEEQLIFMRRQIESLQNVIHDLNKKIELIQGERDSYIEKDKQNMNKINALVSKMAKNQHFFSNKSNNSPTHQGQMNYSSLFITDETTIQYRVQEDDFDVGQAKSEAQLFLEEGKIENAKTSTLQNIEKMEQQLKKYRLIVYQESRHKDLQDFVIQRLRNQLQTQLQKHQKVKNMNKKLLMKVQSLTQEKKNMINAKKNKYTNSSCSCQKSIKENEKNILQNQYRNSNSQRMNRFDVSMRKDQKFHNKDQSNHEEDEEITFQFSPQKNQRNDNKV